MAVDVELLQLEAGARPIEQRRKRSQHLRRQLAIADLLAGAACGAVGASVAGLSPLAVVGLAALMGLVWPLAAFLCGLYAREDLRTWASGVGEAPKLVLTCLALSWPLLGLLMLLGAPHPATGALAATIALSTAAALTRAAARVGVHRSSELRQRTLIVGSGAVAETLVDRVQNHPELGLEPVGYIDDDDGGQPLGLPRLGGLDVLPHLISAGRVDRAMIAFTRAHHEELLEVLRLCRDGGGAGDGVPR